MNRVNLFYLLLFMPLALLGQIPDLKQGLKDRKLTDQDKTKILIALAKAYWHENIDSAKHYSNQAFNISQKNNDPETVAAGLIEKSNLEYYDKQENAALKFLYQAKDIIEKNQIISLKAEVYNKLGNAYSKNPDSSLFYLNKSLEIAIAQNEPALIAANKIKSLLLLIHQKNYIELTKLYESLIPFLEHTKNFEGLMETYTYMALAFRDLNEQDKALLYCEKAIKLADQVQSKKLKGFVYGALGSGVKSYFESFDSAEPYLRKSTEFATEIKDTQLLRTNRKRMAILYYNNDEFEIASKIVDSLLVEYVDPDNYKTKGMILSEQNKHQEAIHYYNRAYEMFKQEKAYMQQKAILQLKLDSRFAILGDEEFMNDFLTLDSLIYTIHNIDNKNQFFELETKYRTAEKETEIQRKELELIKSRNKILLITIFSVLILGVGLFGFWLLRIRQKRRELLHSNQVFELQHSLHSTELAYLNNQLNPHEVKNLISSISPELLSTAPETYRKMIRLFNVTRASLSQDLTEALDVQLQQVEDFLILQQSISPIPWSFEINNKSENLELKLPRLLLKNLAENAVKHGVTKNKETGKIKLNISTEEENLKIIFLDNGPGLDTNDITKKNQGIGISTYQKLFSLMNSHNKQSAKLALTRKSGWTYVEILIPLNYKYQ